MGEIFRIKFPQNNEKDNKSALREISQVLGTVSDVDYQSVF